MKKNKQYDFFSQKELLSLFCLMLGSLCAALLLIFFKHEQRILFGALQSLQQQQDQAYIERGQLLLEQSTWATPARLERIARHKLSMKLLAPNEYHLVQRDKPNDDN